MAEIVYKKISELDSASQPLAGTEVTMVSQLGASKKVALTNLFGSGWFAKLIAAFSAFKAPDSDHADNADTLGVGEEEPSDFHDAAQLTGNIHLDRIPAELTGKNAATATLAATATNALACSGNAATATTAASCSGNAATATNASAVNGLDLSNPTSMANTPSSITLTQLQEWTPSPGLYYAFVYNTESSGSNANRLFISYYNGSSWIGGNISYTTDINGLILTKGNLRYKNGFSNTITIYYWKLA